MEYQYTCGDCRVSVSIINQRATINYKDSEYSLFVTGLEFGFLRHILDMFKEHHKERDAAVLSFYRFLIKDLPHPTQETES